MLLVKKVKSELFNTEYKISQLILHYKFIMAV